MLHYFDQNVLTFLQQRFILELIYFSSSHKYYQILHYLDPYIFYSCILYSFSVSELSKLVPKLRSIFRNSASKVDRNVDTLILENKPFINMPFIHGIIIIYTQKKKIPYPFLTCFASLRRKFPEVRILANCAKLRQGMHLLLHSWRCIFTCFSLGALRAILC